MRIKGNRNKIITGVVVYASLLGTTYATNSESVPETGRRRLDVKLTNNLFEKLSNFKFNIMLRRLDKLLLDGSNFRCERVKQIATKIIYANKEAFPGICDLEWTVTVVDVPLKNAMVLAN